jgi:hypothetical protein
MSTAAVFLLVAAAAAVIGSVVLWLGHRVRQPEQLDFHQQLEALAPRNRDRTPAEQSGIVHLEPGPDEEH